MKRIRTYSSYCTEAVALLGKLIKLGRKKQRWTMQELADRAGVSRGMVQRIEKGDLKCEIGVAFEIATLTGLMLFTTDQAQLSTLHNQTDDKIALLPKSIKTSKKKVYDDF